MLVTDPDPFLEEQDWATVADLNCQGDDEQQGRREDDRQQGTKEIDGGLGDQPGSGEPGFFDAQQWESRDWADMDSGTSNISEAGRQQHRDSQALQGPGEPTDLLLAEGLGGGDRDGVGAGCLQSSEDVAQTANDAESVHHRMLAFRWTRAFGNA